MASPSSRLTEIDLLRFLAAMAVLLFHYAFAGNSTGDMELPMPDLLEQVASFGYLGVDLFFLISGFVISMSAARGDPARFLADRFLRLYPAFFVAVLLTAWVRVTWGGENDEVSLGDLLLNLALLPGIFEAALDIEFVDGVYWSLMVELQFYGMVWLALVLGLAARLPWLMLGWLAVAVSARLAGFPEWLEELLLLEWAPYFIAGALFHEVHRRGASPLLLLAIAVCLYLSIESSLWRIAFFDDLYEHHFEPSTVVAIVIGLYLLFALLAANGLSGLRHPFMIWIGGLTYPLYLLHQNIGYIAFRHFDYQLEPMPLLAAVTGGALALALAVHLLVERGLAARLRRRVHRQLAAAAESA